MKLANNFYGMLGLATKAGKCVFGAESCAKSVKTGKAYVVIADCGLSARSMKDTVSMCDFYETDLIVSEPEGRAGIACGKPAIRLIAVTDRNFAEQLLKIRNQSEVQI